MHGIMLLYPSCAAEENLKRYQILGRHYLNNPNTVYQPIHHLLGPSPWGVLLFAPDMPLVPLGIVFASCSQTSN